MKHLVVLAILLLYGVLLNGQPSDQQWYITPNYVRGIFDRNIEEFSIVGVYHPVLGYVPNPPIGSDGLRRNDIFMIFDDGTHYNARYENPLNHPPFPDHGYTIRVPDDKKVDYLYYTNVYEGDETPAKVQRGGGMRHYPIRDNYEPDQVITTNHDIVAGKDITLIIKNYDLQRDTIWDLCLDKILTNDIPPNILERDSLNLEASKVFNGKSILNGEIIYADYPCIRFKPLASKPYTYINFKAPKNIPSQYVNKRLLFELKSKTDVTLIFSQTEYIRSAHDPNFIEVLCASEETVTRKGQKKSLVKYKVHCSNESGQDVNKLKFDLLLPTTVYASRINISQARLGGKVVSKGSVIKHVNGQSVQFSFNDSAPSPNLGSAIHGSNDHIGWIEFCAELNRDTIVEYLDVKPTLAQTYFDEIPFVISSFIDPCKTNLDSIKKSNMDEFRSINGIIRDCSRLAILEECTCEMDLPKRINWRWFILLLIWPLIYVKWRKQ